MFQARAAASPLAESKVPRWLALSPSPRPLRCCLWVQEFLDTISLACMQDPALLCGTGQVYCLTSLRAWLATGSRTCPKTNMPMRDVQVGRAGRCGGCGGCVCVDAGVC